MSEVKDPAIKLFGKTIPLPANKEASSTHVVGSADGDDHEQQQQHCSSDHNLVSSTTSSSDKICNRVGDGQQDNKKPSSKIELTENRQEDGTSHPTAEERKDPATPCENPQTPSVDEEPISPKVYKIDEQSETSISQEKTLKKPDKILPCPRCNSMDTKFCYYNNYNVNQPRHFCRNCQRYWTAGGTMRNVPVGSGRRKNKCSSASHYRHITVPEALQAARADATLRTNGTVLNFGSNHESMASASKQAEKSPKISVSCGGAGNGDDHSCRSSITASDSADKGDNSGLKESVMKNSETLPPQVPCFLGPSWPTPWNSPQWSSTMPPPAFGPSGFPVTFYPPPAYWGCTLPGPWNMPWLSPPPATGSSHNSPALGKHSRDGDMVKLPSNSEKEEQSKENNSEKSVWIPKTLRIDDPNEAAKSSTWSTLGIKNEKNGSINGGGLFKAFQSKTDEKNQIPEASLVLQANPAAFSRSINFCEST